MYQEFDLDEKKTLTEACHKGSNKEERCECASNEMLLHLVMRCCAFVLVAGFVCHLTQKHQ